MNEIVTKFLLAGDKFMPEMHLKQPGFTYSACGPFTKNKERIQKLKETGYTSYIYKNELDKACFQHDMAYQDFKDLARRTAYDKSLKNRAFNIAKNPKYDGYQRRLASMVCNFFDKSPLCFQINLYQGVVWIIIIIIIMRLNKIYNWLKNYAKQLLENLKKEMFILDLKITFVELI